MKLKEYLVILFTICPLGIIFSIYENQCTRAWTFTLCTAELHIDASIAAILNATTPAFTALVQVSPSCFISIL
ncbi:MAG: hypothetical protein H7Y18_20705 [Clostridiaceae bacterium]|nr:hypothetical protein [Clostridiaceae bacterium]